MLLPFSCGACGRSQRRGEGKGRPSSFSFPKSCAVIEALAERVEVRLRSSATGRHGAEQHARTGSLGFAGLAASGVVEAADLKSHGA